jgi:hypothetical protein
MLMTKMLMIILMMMAGVALRLNASLSTLYFLAIVQLFCVQLGFHDGARTPCCSSCYFCASHSTTMTTMMMTTTTMIVSFRSRGSFLSTQCFTKIGLRGLPCPTSQRMTTTTTARWNGDGAGDCLAVVGTELMMALACDHCFVGCSCVQRMPTHNT